MRHDFAEINDEHYIKYYSSIRRIAQDHPVKHDTIQGDLKNLWIYGPPGVGKSRWARTITGGLHYDKNCNKWWDGYQGEADALIDDFDDSHKALGHHLKRWADRYPYTGELKGYSLALRPSRIIVTSNYAIGAIGWDAVTTEAIQRRFKEIHIEGTMNGDEFSQLALEMDIDIVPTPEANTDTSTTEELAS